MEDSNKGAEDESTLPGVSPISEKEAEELCSEKDTCEEITVTARSDVSFVDREYKQRITMYTRGESSSDAQSTKHTSNQTRPDVPPDENYKSRIAMYTTEAAPGVVHIAGNGEIEVKRDIANHRLTMKSRAQHGSMDAADQNVVWREDSIPSGLASVPEPLGLQRLPNARNQNRVSQPGAYPHRPGAALGPLADMEGDFQIGDLDQPNQQPAPETPVVPTRESGLVEANLVQEDESRDLEEARPVELEGSEQDRSKAGKRRTKRSVMGITTMLVALALVFGLTFGLRSKQDIYSTQAIQPQTLLPTPSPSGTLSSKEPGVLDELMRVLPNHTLEKLVDPDSAQSQAFHWLRNHRNITGLPEWRKVQLFALATFYYAFDGPNWPFGVSEDWLDDTKSECTWHSSNYGAFLGTGDGIFYNDKESTNEVCNKRGEFEKLHSRGGKDYIIQQELSIPLEMALLTSLKTLNIRGHVFANQSFPRIFPEELAPLMTNLEKLQLHGNYMNGTVGIPTEYGLMTSLTHLQLGQNRIRGTLPSQLGLLTNLENLLLTDNHFTGTIPPELCHSNLTEIGIRDNALSGHIPSELGLMVSLKHLRFQKNLFSGTIPTDIGLVTNLQRITLGGNSLTGSFPSEIGALTGVKVLQLASNPLTGSLPTQYGLLTNMVDLSLSGTQLSGILPTELGQLALSDSLGIIRVQNTLLTGEIPTEICFLEAESCKFTFPFDKKQGKEMSCDLRFDCNAKLCGCNCTCHQHT